MHNVLNIDGLKVSTHIGIHDWEQAIKQTLLIDLRITLPQLCAEDSIEYALDYDALCKTIIHYVESKPFALIETVAQQLAAVVKDTYQLNELSVTVNKPFAIKQAKGIRITHHIP